MLAEQAEEFSPGAVLVGAQAPRVGAALATHLCRFERLTILKPPALPEDGYFTALRFSSPVTLVRVT
jgi:hypothetical protein